MSCSGVVDLQPELYAVIPRRRHIAGHTSTCHDIPAGATWSALPHPCIEYTPLNELQESTKGARSESERGVLFGIAAYGMWGVFPLYFNALAPAGALEILVNRVVWSMLFCVFAWLVIRDLSWIRPLVAVPRRLLLLTIAAFVLAINWGGYIYAVSIDNVVESSLGYFINPLVLVLMGVLILHERLRPMQWAAVAIGAVAVLVIAFDYGRPPWIALTLAFSFAIYGFIKKQVGTQIGALASMTTETAVLAPFALAVLVWIQVRGDGTLTHDAPWHGLLLMASGVITAVPLICFAAAARRVPLTTMGLLQFLAPVLQLICGVVILGEHVPPVRWVGFGLVWIALVLLTVDSWRAAATRSRLRQAQSIASAGA
jgi:chloramphenicol-sensitive protein RarD